MSLILLEHVSRHYVMGGTEVRALDDVSLRIEEGEMVAIMGPSGSGKSTLMNLLGCLDKPSSGRLCIAGRDLAELSPDESAALRRETFGFVFQRYHLLSHLDAVGNVELPAIYAGYGSRERRKRAVALLNRLGLGERLSHKPDELSGGQQQRVSIARALMNGGRIILADEPTGALDSESGAELLSVLLELNALGHTVILVTHDAQVASHARRVIELRDGQVLRDACSATAPVPAGSDEKRAHLSVPPGGHWFAAWWEALSMSLAALRNNRLRSLLSMLGISIGIAAVVSITALGDAARTQVQRSAKEASSNKLVINQGNRKFPFGTATQPLSAQDAAALRSLPGVTAVIPRYSSRVTAVHGARDDVVTANGVAVGELGLNGQTITQGRDIRAHDLEARTHVVVLDQIAKEFLFAEAERVIGAQVLVGAIPFTVIGVSKASYGDSALFQPNFRPYGNIYIPQTTYATKLDTRQETETLTVHFSSVFPSETFRAHVRNRLLVLHGGTEDFTLASSDMLNGIFTMLLAKVSGILTAIAGISLLVGGVGVMNIMLVSVSERTREIGLRMAVGARQRDVRRQFQIESIVLCCLGGMAGLLIPWLLIHAASLVFPNVSLGISRSALGLALFTCTIIGLIFGTVPARNAAKLNPVVALARD